MNRIAFVAAAAAAAMGLSVLAATVITPPRDIWSAREVATIASLQLKEAGPRPPDLSNAYETSAPAAALGQALFNDPRFSRNGQVACASCHSSQNQFQDSRRVGHGIGTGKRRTMPVMGASYSPFLFWDGRKDSLWSQALGPLEDPAEHGGNRVAYVQLLKKYYDRQYRAVFGDFGDTDRLPAAASPNGSDADRSAWAAMSPASRDAVNRAFANMGKAIAAYESRISYGESRFDRYAAAIAAGDAQGQQVLSPKEVHGLRLFIGKGQCVTCHNGPLMSDHAFHNTGVPPVGQAAPDRGRLAAVAKLQHDEFNCLGRYSDAKPDECGELQFLSTDDPGQLGAFRTPSLRNVAERAPYMHAGQFATLHDAIEHYARSPRAAIGQSELAQPGERRSDRQTIRLSEDDVNALTAFLETLTGPVIQPK
jgi:cytochrome c peroxidase